MKSCLLFSLLALVFGQMYSNSQGFNAAHIIDDCCCSVGTIDEASNSWLLDVTKELAETNFFRFFKVDLELQCPFWAVQHLCTADGSNGCKICECDEMKIPLALKEQHDDPGRVRFSEPPLNFSLWDDVDENMWCHCEDRPEVKYIDLILNPEANTGFKGRDANRIWETIYEENCFQGRDLCLEERVFYKLISGLHSSISMHIARKASTNEDGDWIANPKRWIQSFAGHPQRLENLYFTLVFELRALGKLKPFLIDYPFHTGIAEEEQKIQKLINRLLNSDLTCSPIFDETQLFSTREKEPLTEIPSVETLKNKFRNISMIMNCVACEKCRIWGKLQTLGLGVSLKVNMASPKQFQKVAENLQRNEIVAFIQSIRALVESVSSISYFMKTHPLPDQPPSLVTPIDPGKRAVNPFGPFGGSRDEF